jgi:hypothetical protein
MTPIPFSIDEDAAFDTERGIDWEDRRRLPEQRPRAAVAEVELELRVTARVLGEHMTDDELLAILRGDRSALIETVARRVASADFAHHVKPVGWADENRAAFVDHLPAATVIRVVGDPKVVKR